MAATKQVPDGSGKTYTDLATPAGLAQIATHASPTPTRRACSSTRQFLRLGIDDPDIGVEALDQWSIRQIRAHLDGPG